MQTGRLSIQTADFADTEDRIVAAYERRKTLPDPDRYSYFNHGNLFSIQERSRHVLRLLERHGLKPLEKIKIFEIGCGTGGWLRNFVQWGALPENICGVDLLPDHVAKAKQLCPAKMTIESGNAAKLELPDAQFDLVLQSTVFTSVLDLEMKRRIAGEMLRVLKPDGLILWYDFHVNNPCNPDVRAVKKREIHRLFPDCRIELRRITLAPPIARRLAPYCRILCCLLEKIPLLCTHYLGAIRKT